MTPYEKGRYDYISSLPDNNPFTSEEDKVEWDRGYWDEDALRLEMITEQQDTFVENITTIIGVGLFLLVVSALVKSIFL